MCPAPAPATGVDPGLRYAGQTAGSIPQRLKGRRTLGIALGDLQPGLFTEPSFGPYCVTGVFPVKLCQVEMALGLRDTLPSGQLKDLKQRIIDGSVVLSKSNATNVTYRNHFLYLLVVRLLSVASAGEFSSQLARSHLGRLSHASFVPCRRMFPAPTNPIESSKMFPAKLNKEARGLGV
ncbi:hypothetical protein CPAR01_05787 [Colletotrichum paranaense]|uniref:Uncharacterized protein n=1 Tax=Colletotrichum paranaense TaxID=1914294 RepID=A0ABQ9SSC7_9PEZI|nr:uncharacterized protein CPAR01_05787 [Colletotrichum paranaense]KAK1542400.1 hypothetical protein CPAR01_05787 [Colletotrichum paranaense]